MSGTILRVTPSYSELQTVRAKNFVGDSVEMPGFKTVNFNLKDNDSVVF